MGFEYTVECTGRASRQEGSISYIIPTIGTAAGTSVIRDTLWRSVKSVELWPGDELLVVRGKVPGGAWGAEERTAGIREARGSWLAFLDDDDIFLPGARHAHAAGIAFAHANRIRVPIIFRMSYADSDLILWKEPDLRCGNVGSPMMLVPNEPEMLGTWSRRYCGDFDFLEGSKWPRRKFLWRTEIVARVDKTPVNPAESRRRKAAEGGK